MIHDYEATIVAVIQVVGIVIGAILTANTALVLFLMKQNYSLRARMDNIENGFQAAISMLNSLGRWIKDGHDPRTMPVLPVELMEHVPSWPKNADMAVNENM